MSSETDVLLSVRNLTVDFDTPQGPFAAVKGVDLTLRRGEVVCLVGESGSGKSVTGFSLMGLVDAPGRVAADELRFDGRDLLRASERERDALRGKDIAMVFQEPMTALNPGRTVGSQIAEVMRIHGNVSRKAAWAKAVALLERVGIHEPAQRAKAYPHELSGGMRQRVMIAIACALSPRLIIADEPTTALDVTVQAQVLELLFSIQAETGAAVLFITHDLGVVAEIADRVVVMRAGEVVEEGDVAQIFGRPAHPYTQALLAAVPDVDAPRDRGRRLTPRARAAAQGTPSCVNSFCAPKASPRTMSPPAACWASRRGWCGRSRASAWRWRRAPRWRWWANRVPARARWAAASPGCCARPRAASNWPATTCAIWRAAG